MSILDKASLIQIPSGYKSTKLYSLRPINGDGDFTFARSSSATRVNSEGLIETMSANVPRLDYSGGASCASLLLEGQRTNLITYSESFDNAAWAKEDLSVSANATTSPDGTTNADLLLPNTNNIDHSIYDTTSASTEAFSVFLKAGGYNYAFLGKNNNVAADGAFFDLANGVVSQNTSTLTASIEDYGDGWYRCSLVGSFSTIYRIICTSENGTSFIHAGDGIKGVYAWGAQVEAGSYPTSYIPSNSGSQTTRSADVCNNAGTSATFNSTEGVLFAEIAALANDGTYRMISLSDGTATNRISFFYQNSPINTIAVESAGSGTNLGIYGQSLTITNSNKIAVKYKANDCALWVNGVEVATDTSFAAFSSGTFTKLSFDRGDGLMDFYGKTKQLIYFNEALSDEELSDLTGQINLSFNNLANFYNYTIL